MQRITTKKELLDFTIEKYALYSKVLKSRQDMVSVYYVRDFMNDLLLIQRYASLEDDVSGQGREEGSADLS